MLILSPLGLYLILFYKDSFTHGKLFVGLYGLTSVYFASGMVRLQLVLGPAACVLSAIAAAWLLRKGCKSVRHHLLGSKEDKTEEK